MFQIWLDVPSRRRGDVLAGSEVRYFIGCGVAKESELVFIGGNVGEETEQVFGVELSAIEGARNVDAALDILGKDGRINCLCLQ